MLSGLISEMYSFLRKEKYILYIVVIALIPIFISYDLLSGIEILIIFAFHLTADIFMSMMMKSFNKKEIMKGLIYQLLGSIIFLLIGLYSLIFHNDAIYLIPSLIYFPVVFKNIYEYKTNKSINILNFTTLFIFALFLLYFTITKYSINDIGTIIQLVGVLFFAVILNIKNTEKLRKWGIFMVSLMIIGGVIKLYTEVIINDILNGATFSYTILPLVVLIGFIKKNN